MLVLTTGMVVVDFLAVELEKIAQPGELIYAPEGIVSRVGGGPANVVIDIAKVGPHINPRELGVISAIGKDVFGDLIKNFIGYHGIRTFFQRTNKAETGKDLILTVKGEDRRFHLDPGANLYLDPAHVKKILTALKPKVFYIRPGYSGIDLALTSILKKEKNTYVLLDVCRPYNKPWNYILPIIPHVNAVHCNDREIMKITNKNSLEKAIKDLIQRGAKIVFCTLGEKGAWLSTKNTKIHQSAFKVKSIDPTGCGDAFCAGVIYKLIEWNKYANFSEEELKEMLVFGQAFGAAASLEAGCTAGVTKKNVEKIINKQKNY